jgi:hypothetical protein
MQAAQSSAARPVGTVQTIAGSTISLKTDSGTVINVQVQDGAKVLRAAPGQTLKDASPAQLSDIQAGDRLLARGTAAADGTVSATTIVVMKQQDVASRNQQELQAWQHGSGGIVTAVDAGSGDIKIKSSATQTVTVHTSANTSFLRYAPDSTQFKDATKSSLGEIKPGDQLRVRGKKTDEGSEIAAAAVISGAFHNIAGTVESVDAANDSLKVKDLAAKKTVEIKITPESQLHQLPASMAQRIAFQLKGRANGAGGPQAPGPNVPHPGGAPDFQQIISRAPSFQIADLKKGDAVMVVATQGGTAVTLISGIEPILTAAPNGSGAAALLSNWNMSAPAESGGSQ